MPEVVLQKNSPQRKSLENTVFHHFWSYFRTVDSLASTVIQRPSYSDSWRVGAPLNVAIPTGAMGNVTAGLLAQKMGCPIAAPFICGVNANNILHRAVTTGEFHRQPMQRTLSEAINIGALMCANCVYFAFCPLTRAKFTQNYPTISSEFCGS